MKMRYDVAGSGPTLVLVHGVVHRRQAWDPILDLLTPYRRVVTVDLLGHGESPALEANVSDPLGYVVDALDDLLGDFDTPDAKPHIGGNSLGGWLAIAMACRGRVASATALSPAGFFVNDLDRRRAIGTFRVLRTLARGMGEHAPRLLSFKAVRYPAISAFFAHPSRVPYADAVVDTASLVSNTFVDEGLDAVFELPVAAEPQVPITIAWGRRDLTLPIYERAVAKRNLPHATFITVPGVGHVPMSDNPELIASILLAGSETRTV
ncbi:alpha/beta hydrolase [Rhodococcus sp. 15-1154-1]|nr:alpha/beta hydrolase [Rhodococcus sp. 15-1154-1]OZF07939.1 alpha/beta hydrolase [Rhodococcus sp. 15-1154-1]